jgi:hypothetical protein
MIALWTVLLEIKNNLLISSRQHPHNTEPLRPSSYPRIGPSRGASGSYTGDGPFWTPHAPHIWQHDLRTSSVVFFHCTSQKVHSADASRPLGGQAPYLPETRPRRVKTCDKEEKHKQMYIRYS